ncbi:MAG TPA: DUF1080 domain-containing protein [Cyclobacteriaceae bacterium]|nr:DUF1080 domain-containing protein [Cyclobacteriaceae bacterium]
MRIILFCLAFALCCCSQDEASLFNGKDLTGWDTYVGPAYDTARKKFDSIPGPGLNNDPDKVFSVATVDGGPVLRISGERFGGISTKEEFSNYHFTVEFKWGQAKYAPKLNDKRDSGLLYHGVGDHGADGGFWLQSQEFQVQEGDCGDYWGVAGGGFDVPVVKVGNGYVYNETGEMLTFHQDSPNDRHAVKSPDAENPTGEWNTLELYCLGDSAVHVVNGVVVMRLYNSNLKKGKIQFQSEGAEVFYRNFKLESISAMPL